MYDFPNGFVIPFNTYFQKILIKTNNRLISVSIWYMISFENNTQSVMTCKYPPLFYNQFLKRYCKMNLLFYSFPGSAQDTRLCVAEDISISSPDD